MFITETWLKSNHDAIICDLIPRGYTYIRSDRKLQRTGGGLMIIFKTTLQVNKVNNDTHDSFECLECRVVLNNRNVDFIVIYRPPTSNKNKTSPRQFIDEFQPFIIDKSTSSDSLFILGDFNFHINNNNDHSAMEFIQTMSSFNFDQVVNKPTHEHGNTLDLVFTRSDDRLLKHLRVEPNHISDHHSVLFKLDNARPKFERKCIEYRQTKNINIDDFRADILNSGLSDRVENATTTAEKMSLFNTTLKDVFDKHAPTKKKIITVRPETKWFCHQIYAAKRKRRAAEVVWRTTKLTVHREIYVLERNRTNETIKECKHNFVKNNITNRKGDSKELFKILNSLLTDNSKSSPLPKHDDKETLAENFNTYFNDKIRTIRDDLDKNSTSKIDFSAPSPPSKLSALSPATTEEIITTISNAPNKTSSLDAVPTWLVKACCQELATPICSIVNRSLAQADFPSIFKEANITPILKKKNLDCEILKNFRPISNLNFLSKLIEKIVAKRLHDHVTSNNLCASFQSAYRPGHSTETALLRVHNDLIGHLQNNKNVALLLLDLSAAFDTVDHAILLQRMYSNFGIADMALQWFTCYLTNRTQRVFINGGLSKPTSIEFGVPQGSVLGPYLFTLYTAPISNIITNHGIEHHLYADDTQLYLPVSHIDSALTVAVMLDCVNNVKIWMTDNKLKLNDDKTELIIFKKKGTETFINQIKINDNVIYTSPIVRNLGFHFDQFLDMKPHIVKISQIIHFILKNISHIRNVLDDDTCKILINSLVTSRLDYCNSLLYGLPRSSLHRLQLLQNKAARIVTRTKKHEHIKPVLQSLHWLPVEKRIDFKLACIVFKSIHHDDAPEYLKSLLTMYNPSRPLRSNGAPSLRQSMSKSKNFDRAFTFSGPAVWNALSLDTRNSTSFESFKRTLKTELFRSAFSLV